MRSVRLMCKGSSRAAGATLSMAEWIKREMLRLEPIPELFRERQYELEYAAINCDFNRLDAGTTHAVRSTIRELIADMRESIDNYWFWLNLYDTMEREGCEMPFAREVLQDDLRRKEKASLAWDKARD
jgi:hypothetical protein